LVIVSDIDQGEFFGIARVLLPPVQIKQLPTQQVGGSRCLGRDRRSRHYPAGVVRVICDQFLDQRQQQLRVIANTASDTDLESGIVAKDLGVRIERQLTDAVQG